MDEQEAKSAYDEISDVLRKVGLNWVVEQVEESIYLGKTVITKADASEFIDDQVAGQRRGRRQMQEFVTTQLFSNIERLNLLLDAIDRILALPQFATDALKILEVKSVTFVSEREGDDGHSLRSDSGKQQEAARRRFRELRQQAGVTAA
ncbi:MULTISPECIES: hypothetical protein [unclassified Mesorhizobium]|uniref:hypothetical protein n=1 Tax=unclassified Mesorhizobium TaxID=325217 RepID=UPI0003CEC649|nr:hypothetical protein [Mesorhizobium sp. LSHC420B00]ESX62692.1 hypothetical protein X759_34485 [Mesorhizobium sp. LSHC420B00]